MFDYAITTAKTLKSCILSLSNVKILYFKLSLGNKMSSKTNNPLAAFTPRKLRSRPVSKVRVYYVNDFIIYLLLIFFIFIILFRKCRHLF